MDISLGIVFMVWLITGMAFWGLFVAAGLGFRAVHESEPSSSRSGLPASPSSGSRSRAA